MSDSGHHITPFKTYIIVYGVLLCFTVLTVVVAPSVTGVERNLMNTLLAMGIATVKASLVILWFMHQKYENNFNRIVFGAGFFFLIVLVFFSALDIFSRYNMINEFGK